VLERFSPSACEVLARAEGLCIEHRTRFVRPPQLFLAALAVLRAEEPRFVEAAARLGWNLDEAALYAQSAIVPDAGWEGEASLALSLGGDMVVQFAADIADESLVRPEHLLLACLLPQDDTSLLSVIAPLGWNVSDLTSQVLLLTGEASDAHPSGHPLSLLTDGAEKAIDAAYASMRATYCGRISTAHLLLGLLEYDNEASNWLWQSGVSLDDLKTQARAAIRSDGVLATPQKRFDKGAKRALDRAKAEAQERGQNFIGAEHLLLGLLPQRATLRERLAWGADAPDEAARLLGEIDAARLHESAGPKRPKSSPFGSASILAFTLGFIGESAAMLIGFGHRIRDFNQELAAAMATSLILIAVMGIVGFTIESKRGLPRTQETTLVQNLLIGILIGFALGLTFALQNFN